MATTEEFLISLGISPSSIKEIVSDYQNLKKGIEGDPIDLDIQVANAAGDLRQVGKEAQEAFRSADHEAAIFEDGIMDITEGKHPEEEPVNHREHLEVLVRERPEAQRKTVNLLPL